MTTLNKTAIAVVVALAMVGCKSSGGGGNDESTEYVSDAPTELVIVEEPAPVVIIVEPVPVEPAPVVIIVEPVPVEPAPVETINELEFGVILPLSTMTGTTWVNGDEVEAPAILQEYTERQPHGYVETPAFSGAVYRETTYQTISDTAGRTVNRAFDEFINVGNDTVSVSALNGIKCDADIIHDVVSELVFDEWFETPFTCADGGTLIRGALLYETDDHVFFYVLYTQSLGNGEMFIHSTIYLITEDAVKSLEHIQVELTPNATVKYSAELYADE